MNRARPTTRFNSDNRRKNQQIAFFVVVHNALQTCSEMDRCARSRILQQAVRQYDTGLLSGGARFL